MPIHPLAGSWSLLAACVWQPGSSKQAVGASIMAIANPVTKHGRTPLRCCHCRLPLEHGTRCAASEGTSTSSSRQRRTAAELAAAAAARCRGLSPAGAIRSGAPARVRDHATII